MKTIILGRKGNQPFLINQDGVSNEHAKIEIDDNGHWWLEDLGSTNGTSIRDDNGEMDSLGEKERVQISEMSFVCLGPCNSKGCNFFAKQVLTPGNFKEEFEFLNDKNDEFNYRIEKIDKIAWRLNLLKYILPPILVALSFLIWKQQTPDFWIMRMFCSAIPTGLIHLMYNPKKEKKRIEAEQKKFFFCPNPQCSHILKSFEIEDFKCNRCKNIIKK